MGFAASVVISLRRFRHVHAQTHVAVRTSLQTFPHTRLCVQKRLVQRKLRARASRGTLVLSGNLRKLIIEVAPRGGERAVEVRIILGWEEIGWDGDPALGKRNVQIILRIHYGAKTRAPRRRRAGGGTRCRRARGCARSPVTVVATIAIFTVAPFRRALR